MQTFGPTWRQGQARRTYGPQSLDGLLSFSFLGPLPGVFTFSRASLGWYFDAAGTLQQAANDTARVDYDPIGASLPGTLLEASSTNMVRNPRAEGANAPSTMPTNWSAQTTNGLTTTVSAAVTETGIPACDI